MDESVLEGVGIRSKYIKSFYDKCGKTKGLTNAMLMTIGNIELDKFTTSRWILHALFECGIETSLDKVTTNINYLKGKKGYLESVEYDEGLSPVDLNVGSKARRPYSMMRLSDEGKKRLKELIDKNKECFKD